MSKLFCFPSEKCSALNVKNLLPIGANIFQKGISVQGSIPEVTVEVLWYKL